MPLSPAGASQTILPPEKQAAPPVAASGAAGSTQNGFTYSTGQPQREACAAYSSCQLLRPARRPEVAAQRRGEAYAAVGKQVEAIALAVMPVRTAHVLPADAHAAEHVDEPPVRAEEDLTAVKPICRALDHAERHRRAVFPRRGLQMPHRLVRPCGRHGAVARIVPAQAVKALQDRFAEYDRICSPAAGAEHILHAPHVPCHIAVSYRLRGQRQSHAPTSCPQHTRIQALVQVPKNKKEQAGWLAPNWSRVRESNPPQRLGKPLYYRCTNPAW